MQQRAVRRPASRPTITVTCQLDGRAHEVRDEELTAGLPRRDRRYHAVCGLEIVAGVLVEPPGRPCRECADAR